MSNVDGRILRSQKSQNIILVAIIDLIKNGNLYPTAEEVAKKSGIAIRTVFRHYEDMETLLMKADEFINKNIIRNDALIINPDKPVFIRLKEIISERIYFYSKYENIMIATITQLPKYKFLQRRYPEYQRLLKKRTEKIIPEVLILSNINQELMDATLSFIFWQRLKLQKMKKEDINIAIYNQCKQLLRGSG
tara:strand:+ start:680 stop:1255 length:576 start_codon:yes stop_codon:yes gene_type:complete